ncbi:MAG: TrmH family RNA methyltransferase [Bdellovibrio sp.]
MECSVRVVLVRPLYEWNIGSVSRAMANMGFDQLILVSPRTEIGYAAKQGAASGQDALENRITYKNWEDFFSQEPESIRLSFSARDGVLHPLWPAREVLRKIAREHPSFAAPVDISSKPQQTPQSTNPEGSSIAGNDSEIVHLIFGSEDAGLSNEDCRFSHFNLLLPVYGENPSLNLSQAVLLALFLVREEWQDFLPNRKSMKASRPEAFSHSSRSVSHRILSESIKLWLDALGMNFDDRRVSAAQILRRLLLHHIPTAKELRVLQTALRQTHRKLLQSNSQNSFRTSSESRNEDLSTALRTPSTTDENSEP